MEQFIHWYRGFIQGKTRITSAWIFAIILGFASRKYPSFPGIFICFIGATLRFWASGYLRKDKRPAVGGPYARVRNPLYLGTYLMALGVVASVHSWILLMVSTVVFAAVYHYVILDEEKKLTRIFEDPYRLYCRSVPRFFPEAWPPFLSAPKAVLKKINPETSHHSFSWSLAMKNRAYEAYVSWIGLIAFSYLCAFIWKRIFNL